MLLSISITYLPRSGATADDPHHRRPGFPSGAHRPPATHLDITRLRADTDFRPEYEAERAVPDYVDWLKDHDR